MAFKASNINIDLSECNPKTTLSYGQDIKKGRSSVSPISCRVCGDRSYGKHYGVFCCDGCSCFFKRSIRKNVVYACIAGQGKCIIDKVRRNWCPHCRLRRCFEVNMNAKAVQEERGPRRKKFTPFLSAREYEFGKPIGPVPKLEQGAFTKVTEYQGELFYFRSFHYMWKDLVSSLIIGIIQESRRREIFSLMPIIDQNSILSATLGQLFILRYAEMLINYSLLCRSRLEAFVDYFKRISPNQIEISCIENIILCKTDPFMRIESKHLLENALQDVTTRLAIFSGPNRFSHLILLTKSLQNEEPIMHLFGVDLNELLCY